MTVPIHFLKLKENIEKKFLDDFIKPLMYGDDIKYEFEEIQIRMWPTVIGKFGPKRYWYGKIDYLIQNTPNQMVEHVIHEIFKELNEKYNDKKIENEETVNLIDKFMCFSTTSDIIIETPTA